ncbi:DUF5906 domain-containing protein [Chryseobacterium sp. MEBOG06]|uniref:primase-helicase family protein n=1 Tax=Chryseobacterium sp. MEBOG06 TaxID=2879938 RepID=UPI001F16EA14|nr:primase-helicase family protein [Chryseobacterium sp. MEBOG06]UKB82546.1 DUF5906 domain-containing protein [Chryseobacterium sp. MEBOG06]
MNEENPYIRVGTSYYKIIRKPTISGDTISLMSKWNRETIITDHGKDFISNIPKLDDFICIPDNLNYERIIGNFYNTYNELPFKPVEEKVDIDSPKIEKSILFLKHIFGNQFLLGIDYLKILLELPTQYLPILCLVSKERATGKTTMIKWLKAIFGLNMTYIKGDSFSSQFNADWTAKLIVAIDEVFFDRKEITERLKYLSTTDKDKIERKGHDREEIDFFAKFILCSNNEDNFIQIDENEIRFWIIKVKPIKEENTEFLHQLVNEIPYFLSFLLTHPFTTEKKSRMWFSPNEIKTDALRKLVWRNNNKLERQMIELFNEIFENFDENEIQFTPTDIVSMLKTMFKAYWSVSDVRKLLKNNWKIEPKNNSLAYVKYDIEYNGSFYQLNKIGRYFTVNRNFITEISDEMMR